jgi:hypothetical protein
MNPNQSIDQIIGGLFTNYPERQTQTAGADLLVHWSPDAFQSMLTTYLVAKYRTVDVPEALYDQACGEVLKATLRTQAFISKVESAIVNQGQAGGAVSHGFRAPLSKTA